MHPLAVRTVPAIFVFLFCINVVSAFNFQDQNPTPDSVRLSLNSGESVNGTVALDVLAYQVSNVYAAAFDVDFNSSVLEWLGTFTHDPKGYERGTFLGSSVWYDIGNEIDVNGTKNRNKLVAGVIGNAANPKTGSGSLMTIKFKMVGSGNTSVSFSNNNLINPDLSFTSSTWYGGIFVSEGAIPVLPQDNPPAVSLNTPDQSVFSSRNITLTCTASDDYGLVNLTLYTNVTGSWQPYQTKIPSDNVWTESFSLTNMQDGTYKWNCKAADTSGQESYGQVEFLFTVQLPADSTPPQRSNGQPSGNSVYTNVTVSLQTDEPAFCKYANIPELDYLAMIYNFTSTGGTSHSMNLNLITNYSYHYYVRCNDTSGNANADDYLISFSIGTIPSDINPPVITSDMMTGLLGWDTKYTTLAVRTDEDAMCKYAPQGGMIFGSMTTFSNTYFTNHSVLVSGLSEGMQYDYYVKCSDNSGNINPSDTPISLYVCYELDANCDRTVSINELNSFINRWQLNNQDVTLRRLIQAIGLWQKGSL